MSSAIAGSHRSRNLFLRKPFGYIAIATKAPLVAIPEQIRCKREPVPCTVARQTADFGQVATTTPPKCMRSFPLAFPIRHALRDESESTEQLNAPRSELPGPWIRAAVRLDSRAVPVAPTLRLKLSRTHDQRLIDARRADGEKS